MNASTSVVQIDTTQITTGAPAIVYLSSIYAPGTLITIRDIAGQASATKSIVVSTTSGVSFLDGAQVSSYAITQPFGFLTVNPKTSTIWSLMNTFAFPDQSAAALVNSITATNATTSTLYSYQAIISTAAISSISTDTAFVRTNISVGQSTIANDLYLRSTLKVIGGISTAATLFASTSVVTQSLIAASTLQTPFAQLQFSTGLALDIAGTTRTAGIISTAGPVYVGSLISTASDLGVGGSTLIGGELRVGGYTFLQSSLSTVGSFTLGGAANLTSSLTVKDNALFLRHVSIASSMTIAVSLSVMSSIYVKGSLSVDSGLRLYGLLSTASSINVGENMSIAGNLAVGGDVFFNDRLLDLDNLSVIHCLYVGNAISTYSSITAGGSLQITGSTLLFGHVSTLSNLVVTKTLSTLGDFGLSGTAFLASTATIAGSVSTLSNLNIGGSLNLLSSARIGTQLSTLGQAAFFSSVQIQGGLSVFSSLAVSCNADIAGILTAKGFNLGGAAVVTSLGVTQNTGYGVNISSSVLLYGQLSTMSGIDMVGRFSTPNVIATGSTLFTSFATVQSNLSTLGNTNVGAQLNVLGTTTLGGTVAAANYATFSNGLSTITNTNVGGALNVLGKATIGNSFTANADATFNKTTTTTGVATFNANGDGVVIANSLSMPGIGQAINAVGVTANLAAVVISDKTYLQASGVLATAGQATLSSLIVQGSAVLSNSVSSFGQVAIFSSLQVQGGLSVFSSFAVNCNADVAGILTANFFQLRGGAIVSTLAITANTPTWALNISSSTLAYGLVSTFGSLNVGRNVSTAGAFAVGGAADVAGNLNVQGTLSSVGQASVGGALTVLGVTRGSSASYQTTVLAGTTVTANTSVLTNAITGSNSVTTATLQATSLTVNTGSPTPTNGYQVDVTGAIRTTGNPLIQNANPGIVLSNNAANANTYSIYTGPNSGGLIVTGSDNTTRIAIAPGATSYVGINTNSPSYTLDVNGSMRVANMLTASAGLTVNPFVIDRNAFDHLTAPLTLTIPTPTSASVLNDQLPVAHFTRQGTGGAAFGARATFALSRWENNGVNSRTRMDIGLSQDAYNTVYVMSLRSDGRVGINTLTPGYSLDVTGDARVSGTIFGTLSGNASSATTAAACTGNAATATTAAACTGNAATATSATTAASCTGNAATATTAAACSGNAATATTATTANALNTGNNYTVNNLTVNGTLSGTGASITSLNAASSYTAASFTASADLIASNATANNGYLRMTTASGNCYIQSGLTNTASSVADLYFTGMFGAPQRMLLKANGRLGIGAITPAYLLDVAGAVNASSRRTAGTQASQTFSYTGGNQTYTVPEGCQMIYVSVLGAGGQNTTNGGNGTGGYGGSVSGYIYVTPNEALTIAVGGSGGTYAGAGQPSGTGSGGGGGYSAIYNAGGTYLVVAGGGGGGGYYTSGGAGGGSVGAAGGGNNTTGGRGGTQTAGGANGTGGGGSGSYLQGGTAGGSAFAGGGGGGIYGGGGGYPSGSGNGGTGGGGGGSSLVGAVVYASSVQGGGAANNNGGSITITAHYGVSLQYNSAAALTSRISVIPLGLAVNPVSIRTLVGFIEMGSGYGPWMSAYQGGYGDTVDFSICTNAAGNNPLPVERLTVKAISGNVVVNNSELICAGLGAYANIRMIHGNYGAFWRNDGGNLYLLLTASGDQYGIWNGLRPFRVDLATGNVFMEQALNVIGGVTSGTFNVGSVINFPNKGIIYGSNTTGNLEVCLIPRWDDNRTYLDYGAGGFYIRSVGAGTAYAMFMASNRNIGIRTDDPGYALDVTGTIRATADIIAYSDGRYKTNVVTLSNALDRVNQMRGVYYTMKDTPEERKVGVIAQEMETVLPEVVMTDSSEDKKKSVAYGNLTAILIEAVKELTARLERIEQKLSMTVE